MQKPCFVAFENVLIVQELLRRAEGELAKELRGLNATQERLKAELDRTRELWKHGQTTDDVSDRSAALRDDLEAVRQDIETSQAVQQELQTLIAKAAAQKASVLETIGAGLDVDEAASREVAEQHAQTAYGQLQIMFTTHATDPQPAAAPSPSDTLTRQNSHQ